jgi:molybdopterin/thiamine biosynthesis adenylyltransferase
MSRLHVWPFRRRAPVPAITELARAPGTVEVRVGTSMWSSIIAHVEDTSRGEEGAFLFSGYACIAGNDVMLVRDWWPIPESAVVGRNRAFGLEWSAEFSSRVLKHAVDSNAGIVLVHSHHQSQRPELSPDDVATARNLLPKFSRITGMPCGSVVTGAKTSMGWFWKRGRRAADLTQIRLVGSPITYWRSAPPSDVLPAPKRRHDRTRRAIGPRAETQLALSSVAVIGLCGGGSHMCQQLAHFGVGRIIPVDGDLVEDSNLGRMIGSTPTDIGKPKTDVMVRLINFIDPGIRVDPVGDYFASPEVLAALKTADIVVSCVDRFSVRADINAFCRRYHLPLVDIGLVIKTKDERLVRADGQLTVVIPDTACLRCGPLLSDAVLDRERRERPAGYDRNPYAEGDPQVVSMNGTLASEAANMVLDLITGYSGGRRQAGWWQYNGREGSMTLSARPVPRRGDCPACAEQGHGDPL